MGILTQVYIRKPLYVDAVCITEENFNDIVAWCQGEVIDLEPGNPYIKVRTHQPKNQRQTQAFVGDWLLYTERGYKVYNDRAFHASFDLIDGDTPGDIPRNNSDNPVGAAKETEIIETPPTPIVEVEEEPVDTEMTPGHYTEAATGKRVLSQQEQNELGPDEVRELVQSGEVLLAQDLPLPKES